MLQKSVNENFETSPIVTRVTPSIIAPFSVADRISRNRNICEPKITRRAPVADGLIAALDRGACVSRAKQRPLTIRVIYRMNDRRPLLRFHRSSTGIVQPIDRVIEQDISATPPTPGPTNLFVRFLCFLQFASSDCETTRIRICSLPRRFIHSILLYSKITRLWINWLMSI